MPRARGAVAHHHLAPSKETRHTCAEHTRSPARRRHVTGQVIFLDGGATPRCEATASSDRLTTSLTTPPPPACHSPARRAGAGDHRSHGLSSPSIPPEDDVAFRTSPFRPMLPADSGRDHEMRAMGARLCRSLARGGATSTSHSAARRNHVHESLRPHELDRLRHPRGRHRRRHGLLRGRPRPRRLPAARDRIDDVRRHTGRIPCRGLASVGDHPPRPALVAGDARSDRRRLGRGSRHDGPPRLLAPRRAHAGSLAGPPVAVHRGADPRLRRGDRLARLPATAGHAVAR